METIKAALGSSKWWVYTGLAMGAAVGGLFALGVAPLAATLGGACAAFVGAFAHVLAAAAAAAAAGSEK